MPKARKVKSPVTIRLRPEHSEALTNLSQNWGIPESQIVSLALEALLEDVTRANGKITLPFSRPGKAE